MSQDILYLITALVTSGATLSAVWLKHKLTCTDHCKVLEEEMKQNTNVYTALEYTLEEAGADRAYVFEFHNGDHYFSGRGQQKFSCTYEVVKEGISAESSQSQNYRVSNFHHYIKSLIGEGHFSHDNLDSIEDYGLIKLLDHKGVQSIYNVPLKTLNGKIIGLVGLDFVKNPRKGGAIGFCGNPKGHLKDLLKDQARIIAGYLV